MIPVPVLPRSHAPAPINAGLDIEPRDLGLPPAFKAWRPGQLRALYRTIESTARFIAQNAPTGFGKSVYAIALAILFGVRTCIQTSTKALQDQYLFYFDGMGLVDIRGAHNYPCPIEKGATCADGRMLGCKNSECPRTRALNRAKEAQIVITNYPCYIHSYANGDGLGEFGMLILDEAHSISEELSSFLEIAITHSDYEIDCYSRLSAPPPYGQSRVSMWSEWAARSVPEIKAFIEQLKQANAGLGILRTVSHCHQDLTRLAAIGADWLMEEQPGVSVHFAPLWPAEYAENLLYRRVEKVIFLSATIVRKSLDINGVPVNEREFLEQTHSFDPNRCPVYLFGGSRIDFRSSEGQLQEWIGRMDTAIGKRLDRKGLIHTVSYARQEDIVTRSQFAHLILSPKTLTLDKTIEVFRQCAPPKLLASPAITTGYDFPFRDAEYQFIMKVPFIDNRGMVLKARAAADPDYLPYLTAQTFVQMCGRIMRDPDDCGETIVLDAHANWFLKKHRSLFPSWFLRQLRYPEGQPLPPPPLPPVVQPAA